MWVMEGECMSEVGELRPLYVRVHPADNVAIIVNEGGLAAGTRFESGLVLLEAIPEAHKVALTAIARGEAVVRYGVVIGRAEQDLAAGSWVHEGLLTTPAAPDLRKLEENISGRLYEQPTSHPSQEREGWGTRGFGVGEGSAVVCFRKRYPTLSQSARKGGAPGLVVG